jgi:nucleotide-binding universal stress UspA family protein
MNTEDHPMQPIRTILHPTDFSEHSDHALHIAVSLARDCGARLIVLHVLHGAEPPGWLYDRMAGSFPWTEDSDVILERKLLPIKESSPGLHVEHRVVEGSPPEEILGVAREHHCDLIVMGIRGLAGLHPGLMGSVAEEVMRKACCPVLTLRDPTLAPSPDSSTDDREPTAAASRDEAGDAKSRIGPGQGPHSLGRRG